jgi:transcriptional regulator with XRE-family HTH domain
MLSDTLEKGLRFYRIGEKLRRLRLRKKLGLVELGEHTGLSPALLSKLERGQLFPTLPTLLRISLVYSVGLEHFFTDERKNFSIVRKKERIRMPETQDSEQIAYHFESLDFPVVERKCSSYYVEFEPLKLAEVKFHEHSGVELIFLITGKLGLTIDEEEHKLKEGDSVYFDSSAPHGYRRIGKNPCHAFLVSIPD